MKFYDLQLQVYIARFKPFDWRQALHLGSPLLFAMNKLALVYLRFFDT